MRRTIHLREEQLDDTAQLLVRFNDGQNEGQALSLALRSAPLYRVLPGYEQSGAVTVSVYLVTSQAEAVGLTTGFGLDRFGLCTAGQIRGAGFGLVATTILEDGVPAPFSDRHADVIVASYPAGTEAYTDQLPRAFRKQIRAALQPQYNQALRLFDPRYTVTLP